MPRRIAIIGLGLIGGSMARDLATRGVTVLGYDADPATVRAALDEGIITTALGPDLTGVETVDLLVIATPVARAPGVLETAAPRLCQVGLVTDVGSTKEGVVAAAERLDLAPRFVGSHPLAGDHRAGWSAARMGLFRGARVFLTPTSATRPEAMLAVRTLWAMVGASTEEITAAAHDQLLAWTSHLPQSVSTALAHVLAAERIGPAELGPGGRDLTRLAESSPALWTEIALENAGALGPAVQALEERLRHLRHALEAGDQGAVQEFFTSGREWSQEPDARRG
jgi:prephenate dehydrogenase